MDNEKRIRKYRAEVMRDLRRQMKLITGAMAEEDTYCLDIYSNTLAASALQLRSDLMREKLEEVNA
jgi:plasmid maintenance system killer protein